MSDIQDTGEDSSFDFLNDIPAEAEAPVEQVDTNWEERYKTEVQDRIKERERYKPIRQTFDKMHPDDAQAVAQFANAWAAGDQETAIKWMVDNAKTLAGDRFDAYLSGNEQAVVNQAYQQGQAANLTPDQVEHLVTQKLQSYQEQQDVARYQAQIDTDLRELGYEPETPLAHAVIIAATNRPDLDLKAAVQDMENQILKQAQSIVQRRQAGNASMPPSSPNGIPSSLSSTATPREKAMARLQQNGLWPLDIKKKIDTICVLSWIGQYVIHASRHLAEVSWVKQRML